MNADNEAHGNGCFIDSCGSKFEGSFVNGTITGITKVEYSFGVIAIGEIRQGNWTGFRTAYFE